jgi:transcription initiation factor IIE alpha subunit
MHKFITDSRVLTNILDRVLELVLKKGVVQTNELKIIFGLKDRELDRILYVLLMSGLVKLDHQTYLAPTASARIFLRDDEDIEKDKIRSDR